MEKWKLDPKELEKHRARWAKLAKEHGWYFEPFHLQVWVQEDGVIQDSLAHKGMEKQEKDLIIRV